MSLFSKEPDFSFRFTIPKKYLLNANTMPSNIYVKSSSASWLRKQGSLQALEAHPDREISEILISLAENEVSLKKKKASAHKKMKKKGLPPEEIKRELEQFDSSNGTSVKPENISYPLNRFSLVATVFSPTRRRCDPPNYSPTVKHILDGIIDAGLAPDDSYHYLNFTVFTYGGLSGSKDFDIQLDFYEEDLNEHD